MGVLEQFGLKDKAAIVTGCGRGIGQALSVALAEAGADIFGVGSSPFAEETERAVVAAGRRFTYLQMDLSDASRVAEVVSGAVAAYGKVDILVNNAGIIRRADAIDFTVKDWDDVMNVNLRTMFFLSQAVARRFQDQESGGKIINIASMLAFQGGVRAPSYTASKSGVRGITMALANEWAQAGICVNAIAPGYVATDNTSAIRSDEKRSDEILSRIPAGRWAVPADFAGAVVFLASASSDYVNGAVIPVDGGWLAR